MARWITVRRNAATTSRGDRGAALVEFAVVMMLFVTLVFGIMEAGWAFAQSVEVRNAAREGGRLAVVDYGTAAEIATEVCDRSAISAPGSTVTVVRIPIDGTAPPEYESIKVTVSKDYEALTGLLPFFNDFTLQSEVEMRLERELENLTADGSGSCA